MDIEQLYREHYHIVYGYLLSLCADRTLAEDLASETFERGIRKIGSFREGKITTWLCAIGRNLYLDECRRRKRLVPLEEAVEVFAPSVEETVHDREIAHQIIQLAQTLEEPKRTLFFMRVRGISFRDIADAVGKNENWCRVNWFRIRQDIIRELEGTI